MDFDSDLVTDVVHSVSESYAFEIQEVQEGWKTLNGDPVTTTLTAECRITRFRPDGGEWSEWIAEHKDLNRGWQRLWFAGDFDTAEEAVARLVEIRQTLFFSEYLERGL